MRSRTAWDELRSTLRLGPPVPGRGADLLAPPRADAVTWSLRTDAFGALVLKARRGDRAEEKTRWAEAHLPTLAARGVPVPEILGHGPVGAGWHVLVQRRLPGTPLRRLDPNLLDQLVALVEREAEAGIPPGERDIATYQAHVLFDDWDGVWRDAAAPSAEAAALARRLRRWLRPVHGHRLPPRDFAHNDLNLANVLADGGLVTGLVDWDEFGLNTRAVDLVALAYDCEALASGRPDVHDAAVTTLLARSLAIVGEPGLRCLVAYRALGHLSALARRGEPDAAAASVATATRLLDRLGAG